MSQFPNAFSFPDAFRRQLYRDFEVCTLQLVRACNVSPAEVRISNREFAAAIREAELDLSFLLTRRGAGKSGITMGKVAGMLAFRLARFNILHIMSDNADVNVRPFLQEAAAVGVVLKCVMKQSPKGRAVRELAYQLARRHANQETLAVIFDAAQPSPKVWSP